ncbi:hypothetical protein [Streptomyces agglomeratus]|uniref:hypothetical protein n=1 Tax=Streptomyces agglomeratus TaxID=285458 RepID=UPI001FD2FFBA|nr:hypothetical protein [Streptomyces agglomeratus]
MRSNGGQQWREAGDLRGPVRHPQLGHDVSAGQDRGQQMSCRGGIGARAPGALAVQRQTLGARGITAEQVGQAAGHTSVSTRRIVEAAGARRTPSGPSARAPSRARASCGALAAHCPTAA